MNEKEAHKWIDQHLDDGVYCGDGRSITGADRRKLVAQVIEASRLQNEDYAWEGSADSLEQYLEGIQKREYAAELKRQKEVRDQLAYEEESRQRRQREKERQLQEAEAKAKAARCQRVNNLIELYKENQMELHHITPLLSDILSVTDADVGINKKILHILKSIADVLRNKNHISYQGEFFQEVIQWLATAKVKISIGFIDADIFQQFRTLDTIWLSATKIMDEDIQRFAQIPAGRLTVFEATDCQFEHPKTKHDLLEGLFKHPRLSVLTLKNCGITRNYVEKIEQHLEENIPLTQVDISSDLLPKKECERVEKLAVRNKFLSRCDAVFEKINQEKAIQKQCEMLRELNWTLQPYKEALSENKIVDKKIVALIEQHTALSEKLVVQRMEQVTVTDEKKFSVEFRQFQELVYALASSQTRQQELFQHMVDRVFNGNNIPNAVLDFTTKFACVKKLNYPTKPSAPPLGMLVVGEGTSPVFSRISSGDGNRANLSIPIDNPSLR